MQEGNIWEALLAISKYNPENLVVIIDANNVQLDGYVTDIMNIYPLKEKLESYNFKVHEVYGHNIEDMVELFENNLSKDKSNIIIAKTIKGRGISFMENKNTWHGKAPNEDEYLRGLKELEGGAR